MKERPILFNSAMVRAILEGRKTQTRRAVKPAGAHHLFQFKGKEWLRGADEPTGEWAWCSSERLVSKHIRCPYGQSGDRLWVRETFIQGWPCRNDGIPDQYDEDGNEKPIRTWYRATDPNLSWTNDDGWTMERTPWKPSIHMPRWASRILLEITDVRVERLQEISEADALAEGVTFNHAVKPSRAERMARDSYADLWEAINGHGSWADNPWVWVIEFRRVESGAA